MAPERNDGAALFLAAFGLAFAGAVAWVLWPEPKPTKRPSKTASGPGDLPQIDFTQAKLHFDNGFPDAKYLGISFAGLCGGMSFTALDYFWANQTAPSTTKTPSTETDWLGQYIYNRQADSLLANNAANGAKFIAMTANPSDDLMGDISDAEWPTLKAAIDNATPVPIGLIHAPWSPDITRGHQVVAVGYEEDEWGRTIYIWDPNHPNSTNQYIRQPINQTHWFEFGDGSKAEWRGFFVESYTTNVPEPDLVV